MAASDNLRLQVILAAVDRATGPFRRVLNGSRGVATALRNQRDALRQLNSQQRDIGAYREQVAQAQRAKAALDTQRQSVRTLAQQIKATGTPTAAMNAEFERAVRTARELKSAHGAQEAGLQRLRGRLETAGISTRELVTHERRLRGEIDSTNAAMRAQQQRLVAIDAAQRRTARIQSAGLQASAYGAGMAFAGQRALGASVLPISDAMEFESAMADVRKVVDFKTPQQFLQMGRDVENLSMRLPMLPADIAKIVAAAGQAAIPRQELVRFAEDAAKMGVAFDSSAEEAGQTMATWRTAFRMGQDEVVVLADKINYLGNTGPASVNKISAVVNRIGALGEVAGLQSGPLAALGATVAGMGIESEVSATGIKNMLLTLASGESATKSQREAFDKLGIKATTMAQRMQKDAGGAIMSVLQKLRALPKAEQAATMTQLFGRESIGAIAPLLTNLELLQGNFAKVADAQRYGGSMSAEYASRVATSANSLQLLKNTAVVVSQSIGQTLLPQFKALTERTAAVVGQVTTWIRANPVLVGAIAKTAIASAALVTILGGLLVAGGVAAMAFSQIHGAVALLSGGGGLGALLRQGLAFGGRVLPMLANGARLLLPLLGGVSLPVLAIGAAVAAVALLVWKYWGPIKAFAIGVWQGFVDVAAPVLAELKAALAPLGPVWDTVAAAMGQAWTWVKQLLTPFEATTAQLHGATQAGRGFGQILGAVLVTQLQLAVKAIGWLVQAFVFVLPVIKQILGGVWQTVQGTWSLIVGVFTGNGDRIRQGLLQLWAGINLQLANWPARMLQAGADMISGLLQPFASVLPVIKQILGGVWQTVQGTWSLIVGVFTGNGDRIRQGLLQLWAGINLQLANWPARMLQAGADMISGLLQPFASVLPVIKQILGGVWQTVQGTWSLIVGVFTGNGDRIRQGLLQLWAGINLQLANWPARMLQVGADMISGLFQPFASVLPIIKQILGGVWQTVQSTWSLIVGVFTVNGDRIRQGLLQLWAGINLQLANWPARMLQAGADMISGLVQGIRSKLGAASNAIASVGTGVVDRFKGLLGIHSPSRVFAQLGGFTMEGLTVGLQRGQGAPVQAVMALGNRLRAVGAGLALATATAPVAAIDSRAPLSAPARGPSAASAPAGGNSYVIHVHAAPGMDATALAREVARQLEERERRTAASRRSSLRDD